MKLFLFLSCSLILIGHTSPIKNNAVQQLSLGNCHIVSSKVEKEFQLTISGNAYSSYSYDLEFAKDLLKRLHAEGNCK